jgi:hypothetical protein
MNTRGLVIRMGNRRRAERHGEERGNSKWQTVGDVAVRVLELAVAAATLYVTLKGGGPAGH